MSFESLPSRSEVMGWNFAILADYLKKMKLSGCDRVVMKNNMSGAKFLNMSDKDLKRFPTAHIPFITKICKDINQNNKQKKTLSKRSEPPVLPHPESNPGGWDSDEFEQEQSDSDYEEPDINNCEEDNYICADAQESDDDYEPPPTIQSSDIPSHLRVAQPLGGGDYLDSVPRGSADRTAKVTNKSASFPRGHINAKSRPDPSPHRPLPPSKSKPGPGVPMVDRSKKPGPFSPSKKDPGVAGKPAKINAVNITSNLPTSSTAMPVLPSPKFNSLQRTDLPPPPANVMMGQDMDPQWYVGQLTRGEAEVALKQAKKDGSFLIRDSSKGCHEQPYTLMVLHQHKVYNIQIRFLGNKDGYSLGTGLKGIENFPSVMDMVFHHMKTPLFLIDGMDRGGGPQGQCCLIHPAGF
ncbi:lymphocyte cytosolic protein 2 [Triplophysa dalaica]|uniref:lymphocyte cytosolic protein 2 n=1 Tax=Triplophysa dalaica TaxID=1582913 RepID=UPI0024DF3C83|nr:lymphocyte cytosolic protein 2 [Triplophysa dalaica]